MLRLTHNPAPTPGRFACHWRHPDGPRWYGLAPGLRYPNGTIMLTGPAILRWSPDATLNRVDP